MAHRDAAHENQITSIHIHSVEWSDRSEPVQKRTFSGPYVHYKRDTVRNSESALVSLGSTHSPLAGLFLSGGFLDLLNSLYFCR